MAKFNFLNSFGNPFVRLLIRSPFHSMIDHSVALIIYTGRKTGVTRSVPVNYLKEGNTLHIISLSSRKWWRNLHGGAAVKVVVEGKEHNGWAELIENGEQVIGELHKIYSANPQLARYIQIGLDENGVPLEKDLKAAAKKRVAIRIQLT